LPVPAIQESPACGEGDTVPRYATHPATLPVTWRLQEEGEEEEPREPDRNYRSGEQLAWRLRETPGATSYTLICRPETSVAQKPGDYAMRLKITLVPVM
jgi:hypothetical protein